MILKKMFALCKAAKKIKIYKVAGQRMLSNDEVYADITVLAPKWTIDDIAIAMELDEETIEKYERGDAVLVNGSKPITETTDLVPLEKLRYSLNIDGVPVQPFTLPDGLLLCADMNLLSVFSDVRMKNYKYGVLNGKGKLFVCRDSHCIGIVDPLPVDLVTLEAFSSVIISAAEKSLKKGFLDAGGQMELKD